MEVRFSYALTIYNIYRPLSFFLFLFVTTRVLTDCVGVWFIQQQDLKPQSHAAMFYTIGLALYGIVLLGIFLGIAGEAVVDAYSDSMTQQHKQIGSKVVNALLLFAGNTDGDDNKGSNNNNNNNQTANEPQDTSSPSASDDHDSSNDIENEQEESLWSEILNLILLEAPIFIIVIALAMLVGHSEGWDWQVR